MGERKCDTPALPLTPRHSAPAATWTPQEKTPPEEKQNININIYNKNTTPRTIMVYHCHQIQLAHRLDDIKESADAHNTCRRKKY